MGQMQRKGKKIITIVVFCIVIWVLIRITGLLGVFTIPTPTMSPALEPGSLVFTSKLKGVDNGDIITFYNDINGTAGTYVSRLCGSEGDTIAMRNGIFYLNGENVDQHLALKNRYEIPIREIEAYVSPDDEMFIYSLNKQMNVDSNGVLPYSIQDAIAEAKGYSKVLVDTISDVHADLGEESSIYEFGPKTVPDGKIFVLSDNRGNGLDSRYYGFINKTQIIGGLLFSF